MILIYIMSSSDDEIMVFDETNENDGQMKLINYLEQLDPKETDSLELDMVLEGSLDFSVLRDKGFQGIKSIVFLEDGKITNLLNIPESVTYVECSHQELTTLNGIPSSIQELKVNDNKITKMDAKNYPQLIVLNIQNNELTELVHLPETLEILDAQNNMLRKLNLKQAQGLKKLNVSNNPLLVLEHVPPTLEEIVMENNPFTEVIRAGEDNEDQKEKKVDYLEAVYTYFKLKAGYEKRLLDKKRLAFRKGKSKKEGKKLSQQAYEPCIYCKRKSGTLFYMKDDRYCAKCGDKTSPCELNIEIYKGYYYQLDETMKMDEEEIEKKKEHIIELKMRNLFKYLTTEETNILFKKGLDEFHEERDLHKETLKQYDKVYNNIQRYHETEKKQKHVYEIQQQIENLLNEYKEKQKREILIAAIEMHKNDLLPALHNLRWMKYDVMYVEEDYKTKESTLIQNELSLQHKEIHLGEDQRVINFVYQPPRKKKEPVEDNVDIAEESDDSEQETPLFVPRTPSMSPPE